MNRNITLVYLREKYGIRALPIFYPDIYKDKVYFTYADIVEVYNKCVEDGDVRAIEVLTIQYNLDEVFKIANSGQEKSYSRKYTREQIISNNYRNKYREKNNVKEINYGGREFRRWFKVLDNGDVVLNSVPVVYQMKRKDIEELFKLNDPNYKPDYSKVITDLYKDFLNLPIEAKSNLIIYYCKNMLNNKFPIQEIEMLENDEITVI